MHFRCFRIHGSSSFRGCFLYAHSIERVLRHALLVEDVSFLIMDQEFSLKKLVRDYIYGIFYRFMDDQVTLYAGQSSYFILTSMVPILIITISILQAWHLDPSTVISIFLEATPDFLNDAVRGILEEVMKNSIAIISMSVVAVIWTSGKAFQGIAYGLNNVMGIKDRRNYFYLRFRAILYTLAFTVIVVFLIFFAAYGGRIKGLLTKYLKLPLDSFGITTLFMFRYVIMLGIMSVLLSLMFTFLPNRKFKVRQMASTGFICALSWLVFTLFLALFTMSFNAFSIYGSMFMVLTWMLWLYGCMIIFFVCAQVHSMVDYMFKCLWRKMRGMGPCAKEPIPEDVREVVTYAGAIKKEKEKEKEKKKNEGKT